MTTTTETPALRDSAANANAVLAAVCLAATVLPLSFAGAAVATPAIGRELGGGPAALNWIVNAFMLSFGGCLMAAGALADRYGRKRLFVLGIGGFALVSLALTLVRSVLWLDILRAAQGAAAAAALAGGTAALAQEFEGHARARAFSLIGTTFGVGLALGPVLAGLLIETVGWRAIFLSGTIVGAASLAFGAPKMRESRDPDAGRLDWPGAASSTAALVLLASGVMQAPEAGWSHPLTIGLLASAALGFALFVTIEMRTRRPMLDLSLFRYPAFVGVQLLPIATACCYVVLLVLLPLRFIGVEGLDAIHAGLLMMALSGPMLIVPLAATWASRRVKPATISGAGLLIAAAGLVWLGGAPTDGGLGAVAPMLAIGVGSAMPWGLMDALSVSVVPKERAGMATGIFSTVRVAGEAVILALVGAAFAGLARSGLGETFAGAPGEALSEAAQRLASGDVARAGALLPEATHGALAEVYGAAFAWLTDGLAAMTVLAAITVLLLARAEGQAPTRASA